VLVATRSILQGFPAIDITNIYLVYTKVTPFKVVRTNGHDEVLARSINLLIGRAAFETAKRLYPKDLIEYRKGAMVLDKSGGEGG
jgi:hypothetical protein